MMIMKRLSQKYGGETIRLLSEMGMGTGITVMYDDVYQE